MKKNFGEQLPAATETTEKAQRKHYKKRDYPAQNLRFLVELMSEMNLTLKDYEKATGKTSVGLGHLLRNDDMKLSKAEEVLDAFGYSLEVRLDELERKEDTIEIKAGDSYSVIMPANKNKGNAEDNPDRIVRLRFLKDMMRRRRITQKELTENIGSTHGAVIGWMKTDDIYISYLNKIKDAFNLRLQFIIKPKEEAAD